MTSLVCSPIYKKETRKVITEFPYTEKTVKTFVKTWKMPTIIPNEIWIKIFKIVEEMEMADIAECLLGHWGHMWGNYHYWSWDGEATTKKCFEEGWTICPLWGYDTSSGGYNAQPRRDYPMMNGKISHQYKPWKQDSKNYYFKAISPKRIVGEFKNSRVSDLTAYIVGEYEDSVIPYINNKEWDLLTDYHTEEKIHLSLEGYDKEDSGFTDNHYGNLRKKNLFNDWCYKNLFSQRNEKKKLNIRCNGAILVIPKTSGRTQFMYFETPRKYMCIGESKKYPV